MEQKKYIKLIDFIDIAKYWDVKRLSYDTSFSSFFKIINLEKVITPISNKIKKDDYDGSRKVVSKITFKDGELLLRDENKTGMDVYIIYPGNLLISNINFHQGAVAINNLGYEIVCSTHYQPYEINKQIINEDYLILILRSEKFKHDVVNQKSNGIKTESKFNFIKDLKIPLPSLDEQNKIVEDYKNKLQQAEEFEKKAEILGHEIECYLMEELGIEIDEKKEKKKGLQFVEFKSIFGWGVDKIIGLGEFKSERFMVINFEKHPKVFKDIKRGKSPKYSKKSNKVILNQKCNRWNEIDLQFGKSIDEQRLENIDKHLLTKKGDILINSTGEGTIGRASLITKGFEGLPFDSHLLLLRLNNNRIKPDFFTIFFNSTLGQKQVDVIKSAQATKQTELGVSNLKKILFPLPPLKVQNKIVQYISELKSKIKELKELSENLKNSANRDFEATIF